MIDHRITAYRINDPEPDRAWPINRATRKLEEAQGLLERGRSVCFWGSAAVVAGSYIVGSSASKSADKAAGQSADIANRQMDMSQEQWDYYKSIYQPVETALADQATTGITPDYEGVTGRASTTVNNSFDKAQEIGDRNMYRLGLNPNSGNAIAVDKMANVERGRADANAQNTARETERQYVQDTNFNRRLAVAGTGKGLPSSAMYGAASAGAMQSNIANMYGQSAANTSKFIGGLPWGKMFNSTPSTPGTLPPVTDMSIPYNGSGVAGGGDWGGAGMTTPNNYVMQSSQNRFADGGEIDGPGTGTSDSIPISASDGEYVIPADVVRRKGTEFFDKLIDKHHVPARGMPFMRPGEQVMDAQMNNSRPPAYANGGMVPYANGGMVRPIHKSNVTQRDKTRKALANIGL